MPHTLQNLLKKMRLAEVEVKVYTWQLFEGLRYLQAVCSAKHTCHEKVFQHMIVHRDIKPVNLLIDIEKGILKIADFGNAKIVQRGINSTSYQVTRFYRPPELLLEAKEYYWMVDVWSAGCCVGEMMKGKVLFPGASREIMLKLIVQALGIPSKRDHEYMKAAKMIDPVSDVKVIGLKEVWRKRIYCQLMSFRLSEASVRNGRTSSARSFDTGLENDSTGRDCSLTSSSTRYSRQSALYQTEC